MPRASLSLVAKVLPVLGAVAISVYMTWCVAIALVGGTIPLVGWKLEGGFWTLLLWGFVGNGVVSGLGRLGLVFVIRVIGRIMPMSTEIPESVDKADVPPADLHVPGYDPGLASLCALGSMLAYKSEAETRGLAGKISLSENRAVTIVAQNHSCTLLGYADFIVVAFRGTDASEVADLKTNWQTKPVAGPWGLVHGGYLAAVDLLWNDVSTAARRLRDREQKLLLTGHSMGGALAVIAAARFEAEGAIPVEAIYTFGQPAVVEASFSQELERRLSNRYFRFVHAVDMVPGLYVDNKLKQGGQPLFIDRAGRVHFQVATSLMMGEVLLSSTLDPNVRDVQLSDHGIAEYVRLLTAPAQAEAPWTRLENRHLYVSASVYAIVFVLLCRLAWTAATGTQLFAMAFGAVLMFVIVCLMFIYRRGFNDYLLNWYRSRKLVSI